MDSDNIMQGTVITLFAVCIGTSIAACVRLYLKKKETLKQSPSMEDLSSVSTEDPQS